MDLLNVLFGLSLLLSLGLSIFVTLKYFRIRRRFQLVVDVEAEADRVRREAEKALSDLEKSLGDTRRQLATANSDLQSVTSTLVESRRQLAFVQERLDLADHGHYAPHFSFSDSSQYKQKLMSIRESAATMIKNGTAAAAASKWTVRGSERDGERMVRENVKMMLRAFNAECEAALANVSWNNVEQMAARIQKSSESINKLGATMTISISDHYIYIKLQELYCKYEYEARLQAEREEQRAIREEQREEEKVRREAERARDEAIREEARWERALEKAKIDVGIASGAKLERLNAQLAELEERLREARLKGERARSMAEFTKAGHVYIVSNIGSFGENMYKVGMTRRLDPVDRILELGDASVPFPFDIHGMIYSENAPELEAHLHKLFDSRRLNRVNLRKEFFHVSIEEIESVVEKRGLKVSLTKLAEAREYRESAALSPRPNGGN